MFKEAALWSSKLFLHQHAESTNWIASEIFCKSEEILDKCLCWWFWRQAVIVSINILWYAVNASRCFSESGDDMVCNIKNRWHIGCQIIVIVEGKLNGVNGSVLSNMGCIEIIKRIKWHKLIEKMNVPVQIPKVDIAKVSKNKVNHNNNGIF